jgi:hypothetical protein
MDLEKGDRITFINVVNENTILKFLGEIRNKGLHLQNRYQARGIKAN